MDLPLPDCNARYRDRCFWDLRYREAGAAPAEWFGGLSCYREQLEAELRPGDRILVLALMLAMDGDRMLGKMDFGLTLCGSSCSHKGCGSSALSHDLFQLGYTDVTNIDYSPVCIENMRARYAQCQGMQWLVMDARDLAFTDNTFDVVLEKGMLDSMMVEEADPWKVSPETTALVDQVLKEISRVLRPGGRFISITFAQPHFRKRHYAQPTYGWSLRHATYGTSFHYYFYVMCKGQELSPADLALGRRLHEQPHPACPPDFLQASDSEDYLNSIEL